MAASSPTDGGTSNAGATAPREGEKLSDLPQPQRLVTGHNAQGQAIVLQAGDLAWTHHEDKQLAFGVAYTTSAFPADLNGDADVAQHERVLASGGLGLVNPNGTVMRYVDFAPGYACAMHRTQSLDYGVVLEGDIVMELDSGQRRAMKAGDVAIQRATQHKWVNRSPTRWARMLFVLQDCRPLVVGGVEMREDLSGGPDLPPSKN